MDESWVTGMRDVTDAPHTSWGRLLYYRLTGQHYLAPTGPVTLDSEAKLGISRSVYFYLGRCEPEMGDAGIANLRPGCRDQAVCPFDTGGMIQKKISLGSSSGSRDRRRRLVSSWTMNERDYPAQWAAWGLSAYLSSREYTRGLPPSSHLVSEVVLDGRNSPRAWTWEGRLQAVHASCSTVTPWLLVLSREKLDQYRTWLRSRSILDSSGYEAHMELIRSIRFDPGGLAEGVALNQRLEEVSQW